MRTILEKTESLIEVEKSKFISVCGPLTNTDDFKIILKEIKQIYPNARHYCYAYVVNGAFKSSDDGEPSGTAGRPLSNLLQTREVNNSYIITIRYFGGIKLGASRLLRTYVDSANQTLSKVKYGVYKELISNHLMDLTYDEFYQLQNYANNHNLILENVIYSNNINLDIISDNDIEEIINALFKGKIKIISKEKITKIVEE